MLTRAGLGCSGGGLVAALMAGAVMASVASAKSVLYVDDDAAPGGTGGSWATAYTHLRDALAAAAGSAGAVTEIRIAGGVYTPDTTAANPAGTGVPTETFNLVKNVTVKGGYAGSLATNGDDRDLVAYETVLSGEIGAPGAADNAYHVLRAFSAGGPVFVDGVTVADGNANLLSSSDNKRGGGLYLLLGSATLTDCTFVNNHGDDGGAIHANQTALVLDGCTFDSNTAKFGGAIYQIGTPITITGTAFTGNSASSAGGAIRRQGGTGITLTISDSVFAGNSSQQGGAIELFANGPGVTIQRSVFSLNVANTIGGAISNFSEGMTAESCLFEGNSAGTLAGAIGSNFNNSGQNGPFITNCTVVGNTAATGGGVYSLASAGKTTVQNSVLWGNSDNGGSDETAQVDLSAITNPATTLIATNIIMGLTPGGTYDSGANTGNSGADPLFVDESMGDYHLVVGSPAIDTGDNAAATGTTDLDGNARVEDGDNDSIDVVDRGAYEYFSTDSDGDGIDDDIEIGLGTDPFNADTDNDGINDGDEASFGTDPLNPDTDMDGLLDGAEGLYGTDPLNPDTDGDGLLDGTEVDVAEGSGCPDPLVVDSDGDGLSDGQEAQIGSSPCNTDTDGDGVGDASDPTPTQPGVTDDFLVYAIGQMAVDLLNMPHAEFDGRNPNAQRARQTVLAARLLLAAVLIEFGNDEAAQNQLLHTLDRVDGDNSPPDWIEPGADQAYLKSQLELLISLSLL